MKLYKMKERFFIKQQKNFVKPQIFFVKWHNFLLSDKKNRPESCHRLSEALNYFQFNNFQKLLFNFKLLF